MRGRRGRCATGTVADGEGGRRTRLPVRDRLGQLARVPVAVVERRWWARVAVPGRRGQLGRGPVAVGEGRWWARVAVPGRRGRLGRGPVAVGEGRWWARVAVPGRRGRLGRGPVPVGEGRWWARVAVPGSRGRLGRGPVAVGERRPSALIAVPGRSARLAWGLVAVLVVACVTLALVLTGPGAPPAVAAPRPLVVQADSTPVPLAVLADRAQGAAGDGAPSLRKGTHVQSWSMGMSEDAPPITLPEERVVRWRADGSHTELVVATDPRHPGRPVLTDAGGAPRPVADGHVITRQTYPPSWSDAPPESPPPHDADRLRAYLREAAHLRAAPSTPELLDAVELLLDHWTLGARESVALARLLADTEGLRPAGQVTDRLGRRGQAYVYEGHGLRRMLVMDPVTGAVLGLESVFARAEPAYGVKAGDVMSYSAWMR
ncbi:CU044_5270 family protein [Streptomyces sp. NPDC094149]|uniref:CU044_5270 family protein n=1 Tax=Streptomyces sp. NPDC094149 TaxID=3155079 RepID=UPI003326E3F6